MYLVAVGILLIVIINNRPFFAQSFAKGKLMYENIV